MTADGREFFQLKRLMARDGIVGVVHPLSLDASVTAYAIDLSTGTPSTTVASTGSGLNATEAEPVAIAVDPSEGRYVYTANFLGNSVSGFRLDPTAGTLSQTQATPYPTGQNPTALVIIPHGNHSLQSVSY